MSATEIDRFFADLESDAALRAEVQDGIGIPAGTTPAPGLSADAVLDIATARGYDFSADDLRAYAAEKGATGRELTDDELEAVTGGNFTYLIAAIFYVGMAHSAQVDEAARRAANG